VIERLDHRMINDVAPFTELNPSAENLAKYFYDETNGRLKSVTNGRVFVRDVTIFETDTTTAKYSEQKARSRADGRGRPCHPSLAPRDWQRATVSCRSQKS